MASTLVTFDEILGRKYPPPLPATRTIELLRTRLDMVGCCASCRRSPGILTCSRCCAIKYCGQDCQRRGWKGHKDICNMIQELKEEAVAARDALMKEWGGSELFLKSNLVKYGLFKSFDLTEELKGKKPSIGAQNPIENYILTRQWLIEGYAKCAEESKSSLAYRLAAENMLDQLCLSYKMAKGERMKYMYGGWMVAGGMDQKALNYLCYFRHRKLSKSPLPYLDLSKDEDIEGETYLETLKSENMLDFDTWSWFHDYMLIALIKYKRLQALLVQQQKVEAGWKTFLMGTHPRVGEMSTVLKVRGNSPIVEMLQSLVLTHDPRVDRLTMQIQKILSTVNVKNPLLIPGIIDCYSIPKEPVHSEEDEEDEYDPMNDHEDDIQDARWAFGSYGHVWKMNKAYTMVLKLFMDTGRVTVNKDRISVMPVEGFLQAAFDTDPSRFLGQKDDLFIGRASNSTQ